MAIEFFTGFEGCGADGDVLALFDAGAHTYDANDGYSNGKCMNIASYTGYAQKTCTSAKTKACGWHIKSASTYNALDASPRCLCRFIGPDVHVYNTTAGIKVTRGPATVIATIGSGLEVPTSITHVQVKLFSDASAGTIEIWINGVQLGSATGLNSGGQDITAVYWGNTSTEVSVYVDNLYISDAIEGEMLSVLCNPTSDSSVQFTPSAGSDNYAMIDEDGEDGDTTYVQSSTPGHEDMYGFEDVASGYSVKAATIVVVAKKDDAGARTLQVRAEQDATGYNIGSEITLANTYPAVVTTGQDNTIALAPDGTAWSLAKFNACKWGFKVAS